MAIRRASGSEPEPTPHRVATTPEGREKQLIALAVDLAEKQLRAGTASAQVISHYLKASSTREEVELERLRGDVRLQQAKIEQMATVARVEDLYNDAIAVMRNYQGDFSSHEGDDETQDL